MFLDNKTKNALVSGIDGTAARGYQPAEDVARATLNQQPSPIALIADADRWRDLAKQQQAEDLFPALSVELQSICAELELPAPELYIGTYPAQATITVGAACVVIDVAHNRGGEYMICVLRGCDAAGRCWLPRRLATFDEVIMITRAFLSGIAAAR